MQRRLNELRGTLAPDVVDRLAERFNRPGKDRVAAMWELTVFHALSKCGVLQSEISLPSGRRPDILFSRGALRLIADITAVSDEGLHNSNPYQELSDLIETAKGKLNLPLGGLDLRIRSKREVTKRGPRTSLLLPPRNKLQEFVYQTILPELRAQLAAGKLPLCISIDDDEVSLDITIDPTKSGYNTAGFATYDIPEIKDRNPLYRALKAKAEQLSGAEGITGVIVGDGGCVALSGRSVNRQGLSSREIVAEFFRQFSSVDFVLLLSVREGASDWLRPSAASFQNDATLFVRDECEARQSLSELFQTMLEHFPNPTMTPANGSRRALEKQYDLGFHGGFFMPAANTVRFSLREFTEILAGLRTLQDGGAKHIEAARSLPQEPNPVHAMVLSNLLAGRLPSSIEVIKTEEDKNDDWIEIRFGDVDPAISPLR